MRIPAQGIGRDLLFRSLESYRRDDVHWRSGRLLSYIYDAGEEVEEVVKRAYMMYLSENCIDPVAFPSVLRLENELVAMLAAHMSGDHDVVGNFTSGGTESIILAVKAARDWARVHKPEISAPEIIVPVTAHAAFHKAASYLDVKLVPTAIVPGTYKADVASVERAITPNTILLVGSAVSYAHSVIDPIAALGRLAQQHRVLLHIDGCIGGFLLPYFRRLGQALPDFDFSVPGVTSISIDLHKYAFAAKGASVILYRNKEIRKYQVHTCSHWTGYALTSMTMQNSRSAGPLAAAWAVLRYIGDDGYLHIAKQLLEGTKRVIRGIERIPALRLLGQTEMNMVSFTSEQVSLFELIDAMKERGWYLQPQLAFEGSEESIHLSIGPNNCRHLDALLGDLEHCASALQEGPVNKSAVEPTEAAAVLERGRSQKLEAKRKLYVILNEMTPPQRERFLTDLMNDIYCQPSHAEATEAAETAEAAEAAEAAGPQDRIGLTDPLSAG
ncbi:MAG: aspartate aminotransferase family protein [Myxococcota bacterium]